MSARERVATAFLRVLGASWRIEMEDVQELDAARAACPSHNIAYAFWHSGLAILAYTHRERGVHALVSQHRDGALIAGILHRLGHRLVRGSNRRGGTEALFQLARVLEAGHDVSIAVDGPVGPRHTVQAGALALARRTGRPIVPLIVTMDRGLRLRTWDQLRLPAWRGRVRVLHAPAHFVPAGATADELERHRQQLENDMRQRTLAAEARFGNIVELQDVQDLRSYWERRSEMPSPPAALRWLAQAHAAARRAERVLRPRPGGRGTRPWVIGVGNLEAGGTGKTPVLVELARSMQAAGLRPAILLRGHGGRLGVPPVLVERRQLDGASDETRLYAETFGDEVPIVVARARNAGLELLRRLPAIDVVLVDDAFQTAGLPVDRHLVLLDATSPLGNGWALPAGRLREPARALARADVVLFTRDRTGQLPAHAAWEGHVQAGRAFLAREEIAQLRSRFGGTGVSLQGSGVATLCGLGRPRAFEDAVRSYGERSGFTVRRAVRVGDHAPLERAYAKLVGRLEALGCRAVVISTKDAQRLQPESDEPLLVAEQRLVIPERVRLVAALLPDHWSAKLATLTLNDTGT